MPKRTAARKLATLLFSDMVGYSALVGRDERLAFRLLHQHRRLVRALLPAYAGHEVETIGDAFLIEFDSALRAVQCAIAIHQGLAALAPKQPDDPPIQLRIALHLGDIERPDGKPYGDTVNIAARLQELAPQGGLAISAPVLHQIEQHLDLPWRPLGRPPLKNITTPPEVFVADAAAVATVPIRTSPEHLQTSAPVRVSKAWLTMCTLLVAAVAVAVWSTLRPRTAPAPPMSPAAVVAAAPAASAADAEDAVQSIAVLPFENRSAEQQNAFFADGVQDEILTRLAKVAALKVISRNSTRTYGPNPPQLSQVGKELGVRNLLQGSVQRAGSMIRIHVQLIDTRTQATRLAETYDRKLVDSLTVQSEIATAVVHALNAALTPAESNALQEVPTTNPKAYEAYLRGRSFQNLAEVSPEKFRSAITHYRAAVALDPEFALAWARLAFMHGGLYWFDFDHTPERREQAIHAAREAVRLQPELGESYLALGQIQYLADRDYDGALKNLINARERLPNDPDVLMAMSYVKRRRGELGEAIALQQEASARDPRNTSTMQQLSISLMISRTGFDEAAATLQRAIAITPEDSTLLADLVCVHQARGNLEAAKPLLAKATQQPKDWFLLRKRVGQWLYERNYVAAIETLQKVLTNVPDDRSGTIGPYYVLLATAQLRAGQLQEAKTTAAAGIGLMKKLREHGFNSPLISIAFGELLAIEGSYDAAIEEVTAAEKGLEKDAIYGLYAKEARARVEALSGHVEAALQQLPALLREPYSSEEYLTPLTPALLRLDPVWDALREDSRFVELVR